MCYYFSCVATRDGRLLFTEGDSHTDILRRAGLRDDGMLFTRSFVKLECPPPFDAVHVDERGTLPAWFENDQQLIEDRVQALAQRVDKARSHFDHQRHQLSDAADSLDILTRRNEDMELEAIRLQFQPRLHRISDKRAALNNRISDLRKQGFYTVYQASRRYKWVIKLSSAMRHRVIDERELLEAPIVRKYDAVWKVREEAHDAIRDALDREYHAKLNKIEGFLPEPVMPF